MPIQLRITDYTVTQVHSDLANYQQVVRLTLEDGERVFIGFPDQLPTDWLTFSTGTVTTYFTADQFDRIYHLLQSETPVFFTAINLFGIRAVDITTGAEPTGEGPADQDALAVFLRDARRHATP